LQGNKILKKGKKHHHGPIPIDFIADKRKRTRSFWKRTRTLL